MTVDDTDFREYIGPRLDPLRRTAYLICGDWHGADDAVASAVLRLYENWPRVSRAGNLDAYVRRAVVNAWLDERRRPWRRERSVADPPPRPQRNDSESVEDRLSILGHFDALSRPRRTALVLRYYCDLSVEETAQAMGCSTGTVKSHTARALATLRAAMVDVSDLV